MPSIVALSVGDKKSTEKFKIKTEHDYDIFSFPCFLSLHGIEEQNQSNSPIRFSVIGCHSNSKILWLLHNFLYQHLNLKNLKNVNMNSIYMG